MNDMFLLIATAGRSALLAKTLSSIAACERPEAFAGVIVIENGNAAKTESVCRQDFDNLPIHYLKSFKSNTSSVLNEALTQVPDSALVVFSEDGIRFSPQTLVAYQQAVTSTRQGLFYGGPFGCDYELPPPPWMRKYLPLAAVGWNPNVENFDPASDRFHGCNWAAFAGDVKRLGGFDPNYCPKLKPNAMGQEIQLQIRMLAAGMQSHLIPEAFVHQHIPHERCSVDLTIDRARRYGIARGIARQQSSVTNIALSHWSNSIRLVASTATKVITSPFPQSRFHFRARYRQQKALGYFAGFRTPCPAPSPASFHLPIRSAA